MLLDDFQLSANKRRAGFEPATSSLGSAIRGGGWQAFTA
jgi:hypothetical protein